MANTICLSTDMQTLYLIPNPGTRSTLPLSGNGVNVSLLEGDVTAIRAISAPSGTEKKVSLTNGQSTVFFDDTAVSLEFIGIVDMKVYRESYSLSGGQTVNIRVTATEIIATQ